MAWRAVARRPGISAAVVATLAVATGPTLAVWSLLDGVLLRPFPVPQPSDVGRVFQAADQDAPHRGHAYPTFLDFRTAPSGLEGPIGFTAMDLAIRAGERWDRVSLGLVTGDYLRVLRVRAVFGRALRPEDDRPEAPAVVVLGHALWTRLFGADPEVVGRALRSAGGHTKSSS